MRPPHMDQNAKESVDSGLQSRRHLVSCWQLGADEGSPSSVESIAVGELVYPSTDASLPPFQKLRGGATHLTDLSQFSEDEDVLDPTHDGSPVSHSRRRKYAGYSMAHSNVSTNVNDATPDEISTHSEDNSIYRVKLLCSYGGKILPRPADNQLRYVGGDTRLITVGRDIHFHELMQKMAEIYAHAHTIKYKLPEEDLDALVSVTSDEDVANMMEEYDRLQSSESSPRLRIFLFSDVDHESVHLSEPVGDQRSTEQRYVDAVNGISEFQKQSGDGGSLAVAPVVMDSLIDVSDSWRFNRQQDTVPVAMLAPQISQDVASLIHHVPVALPVSSTPNMSAPSSAPSSPPLIPRILKRGLVPEIRLPFHPDLHPHTYGHQHSISQADGVVLEPDDFGVDSASSANVHEFVHTNSDLQRGSESPKKLQNEGDLLSGHLELAVRDDLRRLPEVPMSRVPSHGKLTRLSDHHSEATPSPGQRHSGQQPQQSQHQGGWPPQFFEDQTHVHSRRVELMQPTSDVVVQPIAPGQQPQPSHIRGSYQNVLATQTIDQFAYRPVDHIRLGEEVFAPFLQRSISANTMCPFGSMAMSSHNVGAGSAPSSPRINYRESSNMHAIGQPQSQLQQVLRTHAAPNYAEQQRGLRHHPHSDGATRLRPVTSPPRYRDHLGQTDDRLLRPLQQSLAVSTDTVQPEHFLYDSQYGAYLVNTEGVGGAKIPLYLGRNPFQDSPSGFPESSYLDPQDGGDARRQRERIAEQSFHPSHLNAGEGLQDPNIPSAEPLSIHSRHLENPKDWGLRQRGRDVEDMRSWRGGRGRIDQNEQGDGCGGVDLEALGAGSLGLPEDFDDILAMPESYLQRNAGVAEPPSAIHQLPTSIATQSRVLSVYPSSVGQVMVDMPQVPPYVGWASGPVPRSTESMPDLDCTAGAAEVSHPPSESHSNKMASVKDVDNKASTGASNNVVPHLSCAASTRLGNTESENNAELRWPGLKDGSRPEVDPLGAPDRSNNQDHFEYLSGSGISLGQQSKPSSGIRTEASDEVALMWLQTNPTITPGKGSSAKETNDSSAYGSRNPISVDGIPLPTAQLSVLTGQAHNMQPMTTGVTSFTTPALSTTASTELSLPTMLDTLNTRTSAGTSGTELESYSTGSLRMKPVSIALRMPEADISGFLGQNGDHRRNDNKILTSQFSATGHLAEDMASSVLASSTSEIPPPFPSAKLQAGDRDNKWLPFPQGDTAGVSPGLTHAPTFGMSNWDSVQNLTDITAEVDDDQNRTPDTTEENEDLDLQSPFTLVEELTDLASTGEPVAEAAVPTHEDLKQGSSNPGTAEDAEAEAIRSGLQTILNVDLEEMRELGSGTFGTVYHGKWRGTDVAIKRIKASCFAGRPAERDRLIADFWREACTLSQLHHPNVVAFYGVVRDGPGGTLATVTEYMVNGSLKQVLQKKDRTIDRRKRLLIAMDAAFGMEYLHSKNIVHFDLKCDNLLVNMRDPHRPICKVGDLGLSKVKHQTMVSGGVRGTLPWMAPELLNGSSTLVTEKVDAFSFGIVMWELLTGEEPYANMHYGAIIGGIVNNTLRPSIPTWCDPLWKSLMERCWSAEPASRPSFSEVASELRVMATAQPKAHVAL